MKLRLAKKIYRYPARASARHQTYWSSLRRLRVNGSRLRRTGAAGSFDGSDQVAYADRGRERIAYHTP